MDRNEWTTLISELQTLHDEISLICGIYISKDLTAVGKTLNQISPIAKLQLETDIEQVFDVSKTLGWDLGKVLRGEKPETILTNPQHVLNVVEFLESEIDRLNLSLPKEGPPPTVPEQLGVLVEKLDAHRREEVARKKSWQQFFEEIVRRHNRLVIEGLGGLAPAEYLNRPEVEVVAWYITREVHLSPESAPEELLNKITTRLKTTAQNQPKNKVIQEANNLFQELRSLQPDIKNWNRLIVNSKRQALAQPVVFLTPDNNYLLTQAGSRRQEVTSVLKKDQAFAQKHNSVIDRLTWTLTWTALAYPNQTQDEISETVQSGLLKTLETQPETAAEINQINTALNELSQKPERLTQVLLTARNTPVINETTPQTAEKVIKQELTRDLDYASISGANFEVGLERIIKPQDQTPISISTVLALPVFKLKTEDAQELKLTGDKTERVEVLINNALAELQEELNKNSRFDESLGENVIDRIIINQRKSASVEKLTQSLNKAGLNDEQVNEIVTRYQIHTRFIDLNIEGTTQALAEPTRPNLTVAKIYLLELEKGVQEKLPDVRLLSLRERVIRALTDSPQQQEMLRRYFNELFPVLATIEGGRLKFETTPQSRLTAKPTQEVTPGKRVFPAIPGQKPLEAGFPELGTPFFVEQLISGAPAVTSGIATTPQRANIASNALTGLFNNATRLSQAYNTVRAIPAAASLFTQWWFWAIIAVVGVLFFGFIDLGDLTAVGPYSEASPAPGSFPGGTTGGQTPNASYLVIWNGELPPTSEVSGCPVTGGYITQCPFGAYSHSYGGNGTWGGSGRAYDIGVPQGTIVKATHDGYLTKFSGGAGYGTYVLLVGNSAQYGKYETVYGHLLTVSDVVLQYGAGNCPPNDKINGNCLIRRGTVIGYVDNTGYSSGVHLHYEHIGDGPIPYSPSQCGTGGSC